MCRGGVGEGVGLRGRSEYHRIIINIPKGIKVFKLWSRPGRVLKVLSGHETGAQT